MKFSSLERYLDDPFEKFNIANLRALKVLRIKELEWHTNRDIPEHKFVPDWLPWFSALSQTGALSVEEVILEIEIENDYLQFTEEWYLRSQFLTHWTQVAELLLSDQYPNLRNLDIVISEEVVSKPLMVVWFEESELPMRFSSGGVVAEIF